MDDGLYLRYISLMYVRTVLYGSDLCDIVRRVYSRYLNSLPTSYFTFSSFFFSSHHVISFRKCQRRKAQVDVESGALNHLSWNLINHVFEPLFAPLLASCFGSWSRWSNSKRWLDIGPKLFASWILYIVDLKKQRL